MDITRLLILPVLLLLMVAAACSRHSAVSDTLTHAEAIMEEHPDSALAILEAIPDSTLTTNADRALHALLLSQALDKNYIDIASDSLINIAVNYYRNHKDPKHLALSYYYQGRICAELGDAPLALEHFQQALDILKETPDKNLENRIYAQRAYIFHMCGMSRHALGENLKALILCRELGDTIGIVETSHSIGFEYYSLNDLDSAMIYYKDAFKLSKSLEKEELSNSILRRIAIISLEKNEISQAEEYYRRSSPNNSSKSDRSSTHSIGAKIAIAMNDSALLKYHLEWLVDSGNIYGKKYALRNILKYFSDNYSFDGISDMASTLFIIEDSIQDQNDIHEIANFEYLYNYTSKSNENQKLKIERERLKFNIVVAILSIFILLGVIYLIWYKLNAQIHRQKIVFENLKEEYTKVCRKIEENSNGKIRLTSVPEINDFISSAFLKDTKKHLDWSKLNEIMNKFDGDFYKKIGRDYVLSDIEWKVTILIRIGATPKQIGQLTNLSPSGITSIRKRLYKKVFGEDPSSPKDWDTIVRSL